MSDLHEQKRKEEKSMAASNSSSYQQESMASLTSPPLNLTADPIIQNKDDENDKALQKKDDNNSFSGGDSPENPNENILTAFQSKYDVHRLQAKEHTQFKFPAQRKSVKQFKQSKPFQLKNSQANQKSQGQLSAKANVSLTHTSEKSVQAKLGVVQRTEEEEKLQSDLDHRSKGDKNHNYNYEAIDDKIKAEELADSYYENAYGEANFAQGLIQKIEVDMIKVYDKIMNGQKAAVDGIQESIRAQEERDKMIRSCLVAFVSIVGAWAPLASAAVTSAEANIMAKLQNEIGNAARISAIKIPSYAQAIKSFGNSKMLSPWMTTIRAVNSAINAKPKSAQETIELNVGEMQDKTSFAVYSTVLDMATMVKNSPPQDVDHSVIATLKSALYKEIMGAMFPEYKGLILNQTLNPIQDLAKTQMLKTIILDSGKINEGTFGDSIKGNRNKQGSSTVKHAINAIGGENALADELANPNEFAWASLNSSLGHMGLAINTTEDIKRQARETDFLNQNRGFVISINDASVFKEFLNDKPIVTNNHYGATSGPIKDMKEAYPGSSSFGYGSYTSYVFNYDDIQVNDMELWVHPSQYVSMMDGKIKDIKSFTLKFNTTGNANVIERSASRMGVSREPYGTHALSGMNEIKVSF